MQKKQILFLIAITFILKLVVALALPIVGDEAYYWIWGQHLQLSYFDHPPAVAWLSSLSRFLPFLSAATSTRIIFVILSSITLFVWLKVYVTRRESVQSSNLAKELNIFTALVTLNPFLGLGSMLITPDAPLLLFWGCATYYVLNILQNPKSNYYALLGITLGLGFCSKYHIVLFPIATFIALAFDNKLSVFFTKKTLITVFFGLIFCLPVLIWNYQNDFASFKFQLNHGFQAPQPYQVWWTTSYLAGQILIFNPLLIFALFYKFKKSFFKTTAISQWLFFLYSSFKAKVEANWPSTSHAAGLIDLDFTNKKLIRYSFIYFTILWFLFSTMFFTEFGQKKLNQLPTSLIVNDIWPELEKYKPLYGPTYQMSSLLTMMTGVSVYKLNGLSRYDFFDTLEKSKPSENTFFVLKNDYTEWPAQYQSYSKVKVAEFTKYKLEVFELNHE